VEKALPESSIPCMMDSTWKVMWSLILRESGRAMGRCASVSRRSVTAARIDSVDEEHLSVTRVTESEV